jgi:hypothetical protein
MGFQPDKGLLELFRKIIYIVLFATKFSSHDVLNKLEFCVMQYFSLEWEK